MLRLGSAYVWALALAIGVGTYAFRLSFIELHAWFGGLPPRVERSLAYIPAAVLAALVFPELFRSQGSLLASVVNARVLAGALAAVTAWRTRNMIATIAVGMVTLWTVQFLV